MKKQQVYFQQAYFNRILFLILTALLFARNNTSAQQKNIMLRISEIEIHPEYVTEYKAILQEEASMSVKLEPGVLAIFPMYQKVDSTQIRILEMYNGKEAYQTHLKSAQFQQYKTSTLKMVKSLKLVDMNAIDPETMSAIFRKLNN